MIGALSPKKDGVYVDATFGGGGYTQAILNSESCSVIAIDRDPAAVQRAETFQTLYPGRFQLLSGCFGDLDQLLEPFGPIDGIVFDFGVSSYQLDEAERGFSFRFEGPLDMRMSQTGLSAQDVVNTYSAEDLAKILWLYGEEPQSRRIAKAIVEYRQKKPFTTTLELAHLIRQIVHRKDGLDPATLTFQALRIFVNNELIEIDKALKKSLSFLSDGGRIVTVTFHGLEDRLVKNWLRDKSAPAAYSRFGSSLQQLKPLFKKPLCPSPQEIQKNPRSRSAKLRAFTLEASRLAAV